MSTANSAVHLSPIVRVREKSRHELVRAIQKLGSEPSVSDFAQVIEGAVQEGGLSPTLLASEFKVSAGTISRWRNGQSAPGAFVRGVIASRIAVLIVGPEVKIASRTRR